MKVFSFDVFDTCLVRRLAVPSEVFYLVAEKVLARRGIEVSRPMVEDLAATRSQAEKAVRQESDCEDITLSEIWRRVFLLMGWPPDDSVAQVELEVEAALLVPVAPVGREVEAARRAGGRIIFVSDMYLPGEFIRAQLLKHGVARAEDGFYVSGDLGKTKASGNLFQHVLAQEKVAPENVTHLGDNYQSDYVVPRKLGIHVRLFSECQLTDVEVGVLQSGEDPRVAQHIAGAMRASRLGCPSAEKAGINDLASQFVAPFLMGFATWILQRAQADGVKRLYFLSRDCQLLWKVARELSPQFGDIECRYLYVSRQALFLPSATAISPEEMPWMQRSFEKPTLDRLLAKIELEYPVAEPSLGRLAGSERGAYQLKSPEDWEAFWKALNGDSLRPLIMDRILNRRQAACRYFTAEGLFDDVPWAVVDLGWLLTCQQSLWKLLKLSGRPGPVAGYYLGLSQHRVPRTQAGNACALFYQKPGDNPYTFATPFYNQRLLDHIIGCADHPSVHHYESGDRQPAKPAYASTVSDSVLGFCEELHGAVLDFVAQNSQLVDHLKNAGREGAALAALLDSFFKQPSKRSATALLGLAIAGDQNGLDSQPIVQPLTIGTALLPLLPRNGPFKSMWKARDCFWTQAALVASPQTPRRIAVLVDRILARRNHYRSLARRITGRIAIQMRRRGLRQDNSKP